MKKVLHIILVSLFSLTIFSCAKEEEKEAPVIAEVYPVTTPTDDPSPNYTFSSTKAGTITYGGSCSSGTTSATSGNNTITFTSLSAGTYSDCTIIVTDSDGNASNTLAVTSFTVTDTPDCCSSGSAIIKGLVEDNASEALSGVSVIFEKSGTTSSTVTTVDNGTYSKSTLSSGTYTLTFTKSGFVDTSLSATLTADDETLEVDTVQLFADTCASTGTISGTIKDAVSNSGVANVSLSARSGMNTTSGTIVQTTTSDVSGNYSLSSMSTGWYTIEASKSGYTTSTFNVFACGDQSEQDGTISTTLSSGSLRIVLSWKSNKDLDGHFTGPDNASGRFHVYYGQKRFHYDNSYKYIDESLSWENANNYCGEQGGHLPALNSAEEHSMLTELCFSNSGNEDCWIGLNDIDIEEDFQWANGTAYPADGYTFNWSWNTAGRDCFVLEGYYHNGKIEGDSCNSAKKFLCEIPPNSYSSSRSSSDYVTQDLDSSRKGPETITVSAVRSGTYRYYVHNYTNAGQKNHMGLYKSKASVKVFHSSLSGGLTKFKAPKMAGDLWTVFEFNTSSGVTRIRTVGSETSSANVDSHGSSVTDGIGLMGGAIQGRELSLSTAVTTLAGTGSGCTSNCDHATGTSAGFRSPWGITTDGTNLYISDRYGHRIRKIVIDNGTVTTLAGTGSACSSNCDHATGTSAGFNEPIGITTDGTNLYVAEYGKHRIRKIVIDNGTVTTIAGTGSACTSNCDNATGTSAGFDGPIGITTDGTNLYVADYSNHRIRKIVIDNGTVTTLAGSSSGTSGYQDATGTSASFSYPGGITTNGTNLYVADVHNHRIRKIVIDNGTVTTLAGTGSECSSNCDNATGTSAGFNYPYGITTDGTNLYVADYGKHRIRKIVIDNGTVTTLAGTGSACTSNCDNATGTSAGFYNPIEITTDGTNLYVSDYRKHRIRKIE